MSNPQVIDVANELELNQAIATVDAASSGDFVIQFTADITEGTDAGGSISFEGKTLSAPLDLYALDLQSGVTLTISGTTAGGGRYTLSGAGNYRGFFAYSGSVTIQNLVIANTAAVGGNGGAYRASGSGAGFGGGGGAGLGGGLFVGANAKVTLSYVNFSGDKAQGGNGGDYIYDPDHTGGGGGGLGGDGGFGGGGIGVGALGLGNSGSGIVLGAPRPSKPGSAPYGGGGGAPPNGTFLNPGYSGGGIGNVPSPYAYRGGNGGFGGGGGGAIQPILTFPPLHSHGGNGGFGGGGAGSYHGGDGGFGGGGGPATVHISATAVSAGATAIAPAAAAGLAPAAVSSCSRAARSSWARAACPAAACSMASVDSTIAATTGRPSAAAFSSRAMIRSPLRPARARCWPSPMSLPTRADRAALAAMPGPPASSWTGRAGSSSAPSIPSPAASPSRAARSNSPLPVRPARAPSPSRTIRRW
jgi:hypothetical protein